MMLKKQRRPSDPNGGMTVHCPEEVKKASLVDGIFYVDVKWGSSVRALRRKGWQLANEAPPAPSQPASAKVTATKAKKKTKDPVTAADGDLLDMSVPEIEKALRTGEYDDMLDVLLAREEAGKTRKGAVSALKSRIKKL